MQISAVRPYPEEPGEPVHQIVNSRNRSDVSARDKSQGADFDRTVEEHGRLAIVGLL